MFNYYYGNKEKMIKNLENKDIKNVICIKWGKGYYTPNYVNNLYNAVKRNTKYTINFYCFTEDSEGLDENIIIKPLPVLNIKEAKYAYIKEAGLCDNYLGGLNGQRVLYFDLDTIIVNNIDDFFELPQNDEFYIINDWNTKGNNVGQASCYSFVVGTLGFVKKYFEENSEIIYQKFYTASQEYLSSKVIEKYGKLNFWPDAWTCSFRFHCLPTAYIPFLRRFKMAQIRKNAKIVCFHGNPKMNEAITGYWPSKNLWKKFWYKHLLPVSWIKEYWK